MVRGGLEILLSIARSVLLAFCALCFAESCARMTVLTSGGRVARIDSLLLMLVRYLEVLWRLVVLWELAGEVVGGAEDGGV